MADVFRSLCADFVRVADALDGGKPSVANQGQALDGFSALANFRALADVARKELAKQEPVGPTDLRDETLLNEADACFLYGDGKYTAFPEEVVAFARRILLAWQRWGRAALTPIPVSERLPGEGDLDDQGTCWMWHPVNFHYCLCRPDPSVHTHWLPFHALPNP